MDPEEEVEGAEDTPELDTEAEDEVVEGEGAEGEGEETEGEQTEGDQTSSAGEGDEGKVSRRTARVQKLASERDESKAENERLRRELEDLRANAGRQLQEDPAVEQAKLAAMDPVDRVQYLSDKKISALQSQIQGLGFQTQDSADKAGYNALATINPLYKKYQVRVEDKLAGMRKAGVNSTREAILTYLVGEDARERATRNPDGQRRKEAAASRVANAKGKPANARSDASGGTRSEKSLEDRLRGVQI